MRILGEINDLPFKVTALSMNSRTSIKYEDGSQELTFKFRDGSIIATMAEVEQFVRRPETIAGVTALFAKMSEIKTKTVSDMVSQMGEAFPDII